MKLKPNRDRAPYAVCGRNAYQLQNTKHLDAVFG